MDDLSDFRVDDQINNCRFCFRPFIDDQKSILITETIEQKFFELTQIILIKDEAFSNMICILCSSDLDVFTNYRCSMVEKQKKLYKIRFRQVDDELEDLRKFSVKEELITEDVFIDCSTFISSNDKTSKEAAVADNKQIASEEKEVFDEMNENLKTAASKTIQKTRKADLKTHDNTSDKDITPTRRQCNHCGAMVKDWRRHIMKVHLNLKNFFCDLCSYGAFFKYDLEQHMKTHIKKQKEPEKYFCEMCGLEFEKRFHLNAHVKAKHTVKERIHQCTVCEKTFYTAENLKKHAESHEARDKPCEFCGKLFTCMNNLRTHLYYHAEPKFVCEFPNCDKKFFMKKRLRAHLKSHRGQKDFICEICEKSYFSQNDLNRHLFSIHEKLRFFCQVPGCTGNFSRREYYKKHALAHHQNLGTIGIDRLLQEIKVALPSRAH